MTKLISSAIKFYLKDQSYPQIICGKRHCDCFELMFKYKFEYDRLTCVQGFLTDKNAFVDRYKAYEIAIEANQLLPEAIQEYSKKPISSSIPLFSEDIW